jgi:hypothetical protein
MWCDLLATAEYAYVPWALDEGRWPWALVVCWWNYLELEKKVKTDETGL